MKDGIADKLRAAFFNVGATAAQIGQRFRMKEGAVNMFWSREKKAGRLPEGSRRLPAPVVSCVEIDDDLPSDLSDTSPIASPWGLRIPEPDPLLAALQETHGGDAWHRLRDVKAAVLAAEYHKDAAVRRTATAKWALAFIRREYDLLTGRLLALQPKKRKVA